MDLLEEAAPSYRLLFTIPGFTRLVASMLLGRIGGTMVQLILVLFALDRYHSATVAGAVAFLAVAPGLVVSPIAGALLDRHGRARLVVLDYLVAAIALAALAALALGGLLPVPLLLGIVAAQSLTNPLSNAGMRTLFPILVPRRLWERANAMDSTGYVVSSVFGPALAGVLVAAFGPEVALLASGGVFAVAMLVATGIHDPTERTQQGRLLADAWAGLVYVVRNPTLRGLALAVSTNNVAWGLFFIALPVLLLERLHEGPALVGQLFALLGIGGFFSVLFFGRIDTEGRERQLMAGSMLAMGAAILAILLFPTPLVIAAAMLFIGVANGPFDIVLFTLRQRRTDPAWFGRAFAVSMALNYAGNPVGSALAGLLIPHSLEAALLVAVALELAAAAISRAAIPDQS